VKNNPKLAKAKHIQKNLFTKLRKRPKVLIIATSFLASVGLMVGALLAVNKSPSAKNDSPVSPVKVIEISKTSVPTPSTAKAFTFPSPQLPPTFKLPLPTLVSSAAGVSNMVHRSSIATTPLKPSPRLQKIVDDVVKEVTNDKIKKEFLSISVIDVNNGEIAGYQSDRMEYPASIVKLFWAVALYEQIDRKLWNNPGTFDALAKKMIIESDNEAASFIVDSISRASSLPNNLAGAEWQAWKSQRLNINNFYSQSGYEGLNVSQKTYPIPYLKMSEPLGTDKQLRREDTTTDKPRRNKITAEQAAKLMYETCSVPSLSAESAKKICGWLTRDIKDATWRKAPGIPVNDFNPIRGFMGEGVANNQGVTVRSKAGWTKESRQEVVTIRDAEGNTLVIAIFANSSEYAINANVFPVIAKKIYTSARKPSSK
jgi:beta-lactamase class A